MMVWLDEIVEGSKLIISAGQSLGRHSIESFWHGPSTSLDVHHREDEDIDHAIALSLAEEEQNKGKAVDNKANLEDDEQLARAMQESLNIKSPPRQNGRINQPLPNFFPPVRRCAGCNREIGHGRYLGAAGSFWHPECFRCHECNRPITDYEFSMHENSRYHKACHKNLYHPKCDVCKDFIPQITDGRIEYRTHPFWEQKYCPIHERDGTPRCCSCERMESRDAKYVTLDDGRKLCLECLNFSIMDTTECQPLYLDIQEFYEGLNMKVEQPIPLLLVERQALNEAMEGEKNGTHHLPETRGLCLSEEQIIRTVLKRPIMGPGNRLIDLKTGPHRLVRRCEVTAILILYGLPRLLTGSILAHEMMHAWLRLKGYRSLNPEVEEGICQVLGHMWLDSEIISGASTSIASSSSSSPTGSAKKGPQTVTERKLGDFFKHQIESDSSPAYGDGFRAANRAVDQHGLRRTLDHMRLTGAFPH
ncbi:protein DA1-related 1-like [Zingiber officinale]|uniref:protein DA1-related 1-like n=1 Tax=Zingiber officinale TaxID=94328 RepID=UPI001C4C2967|nr:protein DA1-related 1-like [Zingiber officinale]XP_042433180.1 protein DA1-related 1-like [Zingiber officinale]XP_042433181.1 protein DA1-related 1-like [Zingiber officinale]XP_042433182.1 protein DA1-related 1-like [Zingiber officinale]XP_042433183.1 protein DA1-related 1-like [Zingiber officinale]